MRSRVLVGACTLAVAASASVIGAAGGPPRRKSLGPNEREAVLALVKAVDLAQASDTASDPALGWSHHVLKSAN